MSNLEFIGPIKPTGGGLGTMAWWVIETETEAERQELRAGEMSYRPGQFFSARILAWSRRLERQTLWALVQRLVRHDL